MKLEEAILKKEIEIKYCVGSFREKSATGERPIFLYLKTNLGVLTIKFDDFINEFNEPFKIKYVLRALAERLKWNKSGEEKTRDKVLSLCSEDDKEKFLSYRKSWIIAGCIQYFKHEKYSSRGAVESVADDVFKIFSTKSFDSIENFETQLDIYKFCHTVVPNKEWHYLGPDAREKLIEASQEILRYASDEIKLICEVE